MMSEATTASSTPPCGGVDEVLPLGRLSTLGLQHVMVMYAGAVAVPLIIGDALGLTKEQITILINADLLCCGLITLIQAWGVGIFGIRLPVMMGVSFAAVTPMIAIGSNPELGLTGIFGACILAGLFSILISPVFSRLMGLFPPVVTGTIITVIGITLMRVGLGWVGGAGLVMFGMVAATGIKILLSADLNTNRHNPYIIAISLGFGMIPLVAEHLFHQMPTALAPLLHSGILLAAVSAIALNLFFNGMSYKPGTRRTSSAQAPQNAASTHLDSNREQRLTPQH